MEALVSYTKKVNGGNMQQYTTTQITTAIFVWIQGDFTMKRIIPIILIALFFIQLNATEIKRIN